MKTTKQPMWYKITHTDLTAKYDGKMRYEAGTTVSLPKCENPRLCTSDVLHASASVMDALKYFDKIPCAISEVTGKPVIADTDKAGFFELKVVRNIPPDEYDKLLGFRYSEAINPVNPCDISPPEIDQHIIDLVKQWASVWASVGDSAWDSVTASAWDSVTASVWAYIGASVGASVGASAWASAWDSVTASVWAYIGSLFPNAFPVPYPFQSAVELWKMGLIPVKVRKKWRLYHPVKGAKAQFVYKQEANEG